MFDSLKDLIFSNKSKTKEKLIPVSHGKSVSKDHNTSKRSFPPYKDFCYVEDGMLHSIGEDEVKIADYINTVSSESSIRQRLNAIHVNQEMWEEYRSMLTSFLHYDGESLNKALEDEGYSKGYRKKTPGVMIIGDIAKEIVGDLCTKSERIKFAALEENLDEDNIPFPTARLAITGKDPICVRSLLDSDECKKYSIYSATVCRPDENKTRGVRLTLLKDGEDGQEIRQYEVINGTYNMSLTWEVEGQECKMDIEINADGSAKILKRNGVTDEQIFAHTEITVGKEHNTKYLYEALGLGKGKGTERITPSLNKRSKLSVKEDTKIKQLVEKDPNISSALKELSSALQAGPLTNVKQADARAASPAPSTSSTISR